MTSYSSFHHLGAPHRSTACSCRDTSALGGSKGPHCSGKGCSYSYIELDPPCGPSCCIMSTTASTRPTSTTTVAAASLQPSLTQLDNSQTNNTARTYVKDGYKLIIPNALPYTRTPQYSLIPSNNTIQRTTTPETTSRAGTNFISTDILKPNLTSNQLATSPLSIGTQNTKSAPLSPIPPSNINNNVHQYFSTTNNPSFGVSQPHHLQYQQQFILPNNDYRTIITPEAIENFTQPNQCHRQASIVTAGNFNSNKYCTLNETNNTSTQSYNVTALLERNNTYNTSLTSPMQKNNNEQLQRRYLEQEQLIISEGDSMAKQMQRDDYKEKVLSSQKLCPPHNEEFQNLQKKQQITEEGLRQGLTSRTTSSTPRPITSLQNREYTDELNRLRRLLFKRENQLKQAEIVAATRQDQYQALLKELAVKETLINRFKDLHPEEIQLHNVENNKTAIQLDYLETEVTSMRQVIDELTFEKKELQEILIQKDKQLAAVVTSQNSTADNEASAMQLSVQAISMVQNAAELKEKIRTLENEVTLLLAKNDEIKEKFDETYTSLSVKRQEAATLFEGLAQRDMRIAQLDTFLRFRDKELTQLRDEMKTSINKEHEQVGHFKTELTILEATHNKLREELSQRDSTVLNLKSEIVRQSRYNQTAEQRVHTLVNELEEAQKHLQRLIKQNVAKDRYMLELEQRMKENDVKRQATYLTELAKNRQLQLNLRLKEDDCRLALHDKEYEIVNLQSNLKASTKQVDAVKKLLLKDGLLNDKATGILANSNNTDNPVNPDDNTTVLLTARTPEKHGNKSRFHYRLPATSSHLPQNNKPDVSMTTLSNNTIGDVGPSRNTIAAIDRSTVLLQSAKDPIDQKLKSVLRKPEWRTLKPLFFRIATGFYLFGVQRVQLRCTSKGELEGQPNMNSEIWLPFEEFVSQLASSKEYNKNEKSVA